jgi:hypothetical protein
MSVKSTGAPFGVTITKNVKHYYALLLGEIKCKCEPLRCQSDSMKVIQKKFLTAKTPRTPRKTII